MASPTWWTWVWVTSGSWWWTGRPGMLQSMGSQRVGHDWVTELNWTELNWHTSGMGSNAKGTILNVGEAMEQWKSLQKEYIQYDFIWSSRTGKRMEKCQKSSWFSVYTGNKGHEENSLGDVYVLILKESSETWACVQSVKTPWMFM